MMTAARIQTSFPALAAFSARSTSQALVGATALNVARVLGAASAYDLYTGGNLPLVVLLPILLDGLLVGSVAPASAALLEGGRAARSVATGWNVIGLLSLANVAGSILEVATSFPADIAALTTPAGAATLISVGLLALGTHVASLRKLFAR